VDRVERDVVGMDPAGDACLTRGLLGGEDVAVEARVARVAARDLVELFARSLLDQLDPAANQQEPGAVVRVDDEQARARIRVRGRVLCAVRVWC
jgi:hypothetical protein